LTGSNFVERDKSRKNSKCDNWTKEGGMMSRWKIMFLLAGCAPCVAFGQAGSASTAATPPVHVDESSLGEIIVTANKREENIEKVGLSVQAISGAQLAERRIISLEDVAAAVPGLSYAPSANNTPIFTMRGVGFNESSLGVYPAVSVYVDQAPLPFPVMASHSAYDLERIEVLKGPQGTLFGQNSTGGAINYIAAKPTNTFTAGGDFSLGNFGDTDVNAFASGPVSDTVGVRVAVTSHHMDDWQYSITRPNDTNGHQSYSAGRGLLEWRPKEGIRLAFNFNGWVDTSQPQAWQMIGVRTQHPEFQALQFPVINFVPNNPRAADWTRSFLDPALGVVNPATGALVPGTAQLHDISPFGDRSFEQGALRADIDLMQGITLTSLTSYDNYKQHQSIDNDGTALVVENFPIMDGYIHSLNQELRLANATTDQIRWILGANYEHSITFETQLNRYLHTAYIPANLYINASDINNTQHVRNYAFFNNSEFSVTDKLTLKAGVRYTSSQNRADICSFTIPGGNVDKLFNVLGTILGKVPFTPIGPSSCYTLNSNLVPGQPFISTLAESNVSWRGGIDYQVLPNTLVYANVSRGYKAGSFPSLAAALFTALEPVKQESVTAYEIGLKTQPFDRMVTLNTAIFYYDYKDKQVRGKLADPLFGALEALINVPKSQIYGAEADATVQPTRGLVFSGNLTYLHSKIQDYTGINYLGQPNFNSAGDPLPFTPTWSASVNADYRMHTGWGTPFVGISVNARSEQDAAISAQRLNYFSEPNVVLRAGVGCVYCVAGYATTDARIGYESKDGRWNVALWGKNILNRYYWTNVIAAYDDTARIAGMPATYGVTFGYRMD
jgi:iron complex outermembrane receptor protein